MLMQAQNYDGALSAPPLPMDPTILLAEQEHRTQNMLQLIAGLLARAADAGDGEAAATLRAVETQVHSFGLLEAALSTGGTGRSDTACLTPRGITMVCSAEPGIHLDERSCRHLGLAVTEAVLNAVKHAFDGPGGAIRVVIDQAADLIRITIEDDGRGMTASARDGGRGLGFLDRLLGSLGGSVAIASPSRGTRVELAVPRPSNVGAGR